MILVGLMFLPLMLIVLCLMPFALWRQRGRKQTPADVVRIWRAAAAGV